MALSTEQIAYGQQKNREYAYEQAKREFIDKFKFFDANNDEHDDWISNRYIQLCNQANITAW